ncbi:MAG: hypothetical protein ABSA41_08170 [Terriglobia bacterium]|jgi:hypothetical protein
MPTSTWNRILEDITRLSIQDQQNPPQPGQVSNHDRYRRRKIASVEQVTQRPLIVYASACTSPAKPVGAEMLMLDFTDKIGFKTVTDNIAPPALDILIHSPGGYPEAAESIVQQIRAKYSDVRFMVPSYAKSAATMFVMSGNEILMDRDAELGPIDPQMRTQNGTSPAESILEQFAKAQAELQADATKLPSWIPILSPLGPSLLVDSQNAIDLSKALVKTWTQTYMLAGDPAAEEKSSRISEYLGSHANFKSHARPVKIPDLVSVGVKVTDIRTNAGLYAAVDELYCCLDILFANSGVCKVFENSAGDALVRQSAGMIASPIVQFLQPQPPPIPSRLPRRR